MKVREVIELLGKYPGDMKVHIASYSIDDDGDRANLRDYPLESVDVGRTQPDGAAAVALWFHDK